MTGRQRKLLANRITGTPRLSEQAIDDALLEHPDNGEIIFRTVGVFTDW